MIKNRILDHIGLQVTDAAAAAKWYMEVLGFALKGTFPDGENNVFFVSDSSGTVTYEIYQDETLPRQLQGKINHISYTSDDIEKDFAYCVQQGYEICTDGIEQLPQFWEHGVRYFKIRSVTGEEVEFCQKLPF